MLQTCQRRLSFVCLFCLGGAVVFSGGAAGDQSGPLDWGDSGPESAFTEGTPLGVTPLGVTPLGVTPLGVTPLGGLAFEDKERPSLESLALTCTGCHGPGGVSVGPIASLAGRSYGDLAQAMRAFRDESRPATIMKRFMVAFSDEDIDALARYFSALPDASLSLP